MPWAETSAVQERIRFIADYDSGLYTMTELCERFGVSRQTGYKWIHRYREEGAAGLDDRSRAPHRCPHRMSQAAERAIVAARRRHPTWGPRKLLAWLADRQPQLELPSPGRAAALLARKGLVKPRRRRRRRWEHPGRPRFETKAPNDLWTADFKGEFRLGTRDYCYPLTVADQHTRYLLGIKAMDGTDGYGVRERFERIFPRGGPAPRDSDGQRLSICFSRHPRTQSAERLVDRAGHPAGCGSSPATPNRTGRTSGCTERSRPRRRARLRPTNELSNADSIASARSTTKSDPTKP